MEQCLYIYKQLKLLMKKLLPLLFFAVSFSLCQAQSRKLSDTWNFAQSVISKMDTAQMVIIKHTMSRKHHTSRITLRDKRHRVSYHRLRTSYNGGHITIMHTYHSSEGKEIDMIQVDGKIMAINMVWENFDKATYASFTRLYDNQWLWTCRETGQNPIEIAEKVEWQ